MVLIGNVALKLCNIGMNAYVFGMNECYGIGKLPTPTLFQYWLDYLFIIISNDYEKDVLHMISGSLFTRICSTQSVRVTFLSAAQLTGL